MLLDIERARVKSPWSPKGPELCHWNAFLPEDTDWVYKPPSD
jgi:hypothetical protein